MKKEYFGLVLTASIIILSILLVGCQSGVSQEQYEGIANQLVAAKGQISKLQDETNSLQSETEVVGAELQTAMGKVAALEGQVNGLKEQYELVGATRAETAEKIVSYYHQTHVYSAYDLYVCGDMASDVWNMLKAQAINALIVVGNTDTAIGDILQSNHGWVLAEVAPGEYLALETTAGYTVPASQNALYYQGWYFNSPGDLKTYNRLFDEYNVRVDMRNQLAAEANEVREEHNRATSQAEVDKLEAVHDKLAELIEAQEAEMNSIHAEIDKLATRL
ncbi:hypothetical protein ACFLWU_00405 [Chloroflexota bacterium]